MEPVCQVASRPTIRLVAGARFTISQGRVAEPFGALKNPSRNRRVRPKGTLRLQIGAAV